MEEDANIKGVNIYKKIILKKNKVGIIVQCYESIFNSSKLERYKQTAEMWCLLYVTSA